MHDGKTLCSDSRCFPDERVIQDVFFNSHSPLRAHNHKLTFCFLFSMASFYVVVAPIPSKCDLPSAASNSLHYNGQNTVPPYQTLMLSCMER